MAGWKKALIECLEWEWHSDRLVVVQSVSKRGENLAVSGQGFAVAMENR